MSIYRGYSDYTKTKGVISLICANTNEINTLKTNYATLTSIDIPGEFTDLQNQISDVSSNKVDRAGDTMTGDLVMSASAALDLSDGIYRKPVSILNSSNTTITATDAINNIFIDDTAATVYTVNLGQAGHNGYKVTVTRKSFTPTVTLNFTGGTNIIKNVASGGPYPTSLDMASPSIVTNGITITGNISSITLMYYNFQYHVLSYF